MRNKLISSLAGVAFSFAASGLAFAADMAVKAPPPAPVPVPAPVYNWTGFYIGGNVGAVWQHDDVNSDFVQFTSPPLDSNPQSSSVTDTSVIGGGQIGYNWQWTNYVFGLEGDWDWLDTKNSLCRQTDVESLACSDNGRGFLTLTSQSDWIATLRGRVGFVWDRFLVYGTGGAAWGKVDTTLNANCLVAGCGISGTLQNTTQNFSDTKFGWTVGSGVEAMLTPNWTVRAEYLHVDLGSVSNSLALPLSGGANQSALWSRGVTYDIVRFGVNYKFSGAW